MSVSGGETTQAVISGLIPSTNYSIEVAAVNSAGTGLYSNVAFQLTRGTYIFIIYEKVKVYIYSYVYTFPVEPPTLSVESTTATTISLSWTSAGSVVDSYKVMWQRDTSGDCPDEDEGNMILTGGSTSYNITGLEEYINYTITVMAMKSNDMATSNNITELTIEAGKSMFV